MRIGIPVASFHPGNTGEYVQRALVRLGHEARVLTVPQFADSLAAGLHDLFLCVDSSNPIDFTIPPLANHSLQRVAIWLIDFRHHAHQRDPLPNDLDTARAVHERGGWIFQSQYEDWEWCRREGVGRCSWLPLAADPEVWSDSPAAAKRFHLGFAGNVWDAARKRALEILVATPKLRFAFKGHGGAWKEDAAALLRHCVAGFNITSFFGQPFAYDVNMRVFETLSCGIPLLTNAVPGLARLFPPGTPFLWTYDNLNQIVPQLQAALASAEFVQSGPAARQYILQHATYVHRMQTALAVLRENGVGRNGK